MIHQETGKLRPFAGFLVLEVDEYVAAGSRLPGDRLRPLSDVVGLIALIAQPEVRVVGRHAHGRRELLTVRDAYREIARRQPVEDFVVEPRRMPEFKRRTSAGRQLRKKCVEQRDVLSQKRRQLKQQRPELVAED